MRTRCFVLLLLTSFAFAQTQPPAAQNPATSQKAAPAAQTGAKPSTGPEVQKAEPAETAVTPDAPVITIDGVCEKPAGNAADCKTVVTRAQFEQMLSMVAPSRAGSPSQLPPAVKRNMATQYSQLLTVAGAAEKQGIENTPQAQELLKVARMQALAQAYTRELQQKSEPTDAEIQKFYNDNSAKLEQATLDRVFVPKPAGSAEKKTETGTKTPTPTKPAAKGAAASTTLAAKAENIHQRAVAGEPFEKLQKEALAGSNFPNAPETRMIAQKGTLPPDQESVFNLKPGGVSQVFTEPSGAFIYKMVSKGPIPLEQVKDEIRQRLTQEKMQAAMETVLNASKPVLNEQYFGPPPAAQGVPGGTAPASEPARPQQGATEQPKPDSQPK